ncbi:MAG: urease accessory protein UreE [Opitutaceae bacterium]|nr:urease accessory protein UreE [Opitutaceae bacterium]
MILIKTPLPAAEAAAVRARPETAIRVDRQKLARRLWRGAADDGLDFGFEVETPLRHGDVVWATPATRYVIRQSAEPLLEIAIDGPPDQAAVIGWAVGNMHFVIEAQERRLLAPDDSGLRQALDRIGIAYCAVSGVFQPHRFASIVGHSHAPGPEAHPFIRPPAAHGR